MIELNKIYNECALETMKRMSEATIDLTVTSPPYDKLRKYNGYHFPFEEIAKELYRVTMKSGVVVWVVGDSTVNGSESGTSFKQALYFKEVGFNLHDTMIYFKSGPPLTHRRYEQYFEYMFVLSKGAPKTFNGLMAPSKNAGMRRRMSYGAAAERDNGKLGKFHKKEVTIKTTKDFKLRHNVWEYQTGGGSADKIAFQHPAIFPEQLAADHILSWSNEGNTVYDPFMGSGTTAKMAILNNRNFIGSELSKEYCEIAESRINPLLYDII